MSIGSKLKKLRLQMKNTLKEQSEIFNVSINSIYRWEHDLAVPRKSALKKMAGFYDVPLEWLLSEISVQENTKCDVCILNPESNAERLLLKMFRKLSDNLKYKILGYIERVCVEDMDETVASAGKIISP